MAWSSVGYLPLAIEILQTSLFGISGLYHEMTSPQISFVAEDDKGRIVGYVLAKMFAPINIQEINPTYLSPVKNLLRVTKT